MRYAVLILTLGLAACGNSAVENEVVGQAKKVANMTPLLCSDYKTLDVSLGVVRAGTGSMSTEDMWFTIINESDMSLIKKAVEAGAIVKVRYNTRRFAPCSNWNWLTSIEITQ